MQRQNLLDRCSVNTNREADTFVGLKCEDGNISVHFPMGFDVEGGERELRKDMLLLFSVLAANTDRKDSRLPEQSQRQEEAAFPIKAYLAVISDFYTRGYYKEQEIGYHVSRKGKINWNRTIKTQKPYMQGTDAFYLDFVTRKNSVKENELITLIHEYCVWESFDRVGWLFTGTMPTCPALKKNERLFVSVVKEKLSATFNDRNKKLFHDMLAVIQYRGSLDTDYKFGTYRFEYVWERMIDRVFGVENKADYFPKTQWKIRGKVSNNAALEPDTIMIVGNRVYVLDAKYYKYGVTDCIGDLPESTSINKQITYGEYIAKEKAFRNVHGQEMVVYNAFLMPFNSLKGSYKGCGEMCWAGEATSNWKSNSEAYERIQGILIDVKYLMNINVRQDENEIMKLSDIISRAISQR